jgi:hypothetical protein
MPMPYTDEQLEELARKAEEFEPFEARVMDAAPIGEIAEATEEIRRAQARQLEAVQVARARGISWNVIAVALGVSRQAARQRFAEPTITEGRARRFGPIPRKEPVSDPGVPRSRRAEARGGARKATGGRETGG